MGRLIANGADRSFDHRFSGGDANRSELTIGHPVGFLNLIRDLARRSTGKRHARQCAEVREAIAAEEKRELRGTRDAEKLRILDAERPRLGTLAIRDVDLRRQSIPRRAVDDRVALRSESRSADVAAPERDARERHLRFLWRHAILA